MFLEKIFKLWRKKSLWKESTESNYDNITRYNQKTSVSPSQLKLEGTPASFCFMSISMTVEKYDPDEMIKLAHKIIEVVHNSYPDVEIELTDKKNDRYLIKGDNYIKIPVVNPGEIDIDCVFETILKLQEEKGNKKLKKKYLAYAYKIIQEGWLGEGCEKMTKEEWYEKVKSLFSNVVFPKNYSNFYIYKPEGKLPSWKIQGPPNGKNIKLLKDAHQYAQDFISKYWEIKQHK